MPEVKQVPSYCELFSAPIPIGKEGQLSPLPLGQEAWWGVDFKFFFLFFHALQAPFLLFVNKQGFFHFHPLVSISHWQKKEDLLNPSFFQEIHSL